MASDRKTRVMFAVRIAHGRWVKELGTRRRALFRSARAATAVARCEGGEVMRVLVPKVGDPIPCGLPTLHATRKERRARALRKGARHGM